MIQKRVRLRLETLECRWVPSCTIVEDAGVLTITGTAKANEIDIEDNGTDEAGNVVVTCDGEEYTSTDVVTSIVVKAAQGKDQVSYTLTGDLAGGVSRSVEIDLGNGHDTLTASLEGSLGNETDGGATLEFEALGKNGKDTLTFAALASDIGADGRLAVELQGGNGKDILDFTFAGLVNGELSLLACGGNGKDSVSGDLTADAGSTGSIDAEVSGKNGKDELTLTVADNSGDDGDPDTEDTGTLGDLQAVVDGGKGKDTCTHTDNVDTVDCEKLFEE
jgi:hypothetical protein